MVEADPYPTWVEYSNVVPSGQNGRRILSIGTDATIFERASPARARLEAYANRLGELHVVALVPPGFRAEQPAPNLAFYPTNARFSLFRPLSAYRIGKAILSRHRINLLSAQDPAESGVAAYLLKRAGSIPLHIQVHTDILSPAFRKDSWKEYARWRLARFVIPRGDFFRVVSRRVADSLQSVFHIPPSRIAILPIFVDREAIANARPAFILRERYPQFDFIVLMVSRLVREKRIDVALTAFAELCQGFPRTGLVIVGEGPERENLESRVKNLELTARVKLEGWQDDSIPYYKGADLYLLTSAFEGYGRTVVESAAAGLPVVMTDVGVAGEVIRDGETGRVVPVGDHAALVRALREARQNYSAMRAMARRAQQLVRDLSPRTLGEYTEAYQRSLLV